MALRLYLSQREVLPDDGRYYCPLANYARAQFNIQSRFQCISPCSSIVLSVFDTTDAQDTQILANVTNARSWTRQFILNTTAGQLPNGQQTALRNYLSTRGFDVSWITASTPIFQIFKSVIDSIRIAEKVSARLGSIQSVTTFHTKLRQFQGLTAQQKAAVLDDLAQSGFVGQVTDTDTLETICDRLGMRSYGD